NNLSKQKKSVSRRRDSGKVGTSGEMVWLRYYRAKLPVEHWLDNGYFRSLATAAQHMEPGGVPG
ncbi:hypothetical protein, partial [Pseudomonas viridiflava]|uniref:hypothetical protein n=1 Tax=Pseudomonas viridiflava TaxID=33069 RepID=UPI001980071C